MSHDRTGQIWQFGRSPCLILRSTNGVHRSLDLTTGEECDLYETIIGRSWDDLDLDVLKRIA